MLRMIIGGVGALMLTLPGTALAADRFVSSSGNDMAGSNTCSSPITPCLTLSRAVSAANSSGDTIHIGPGTYTGGINTAKNLIFQGAGSGSLASAAGATVIDGSPNQAIKLTGGGGLHDLRALGGSTGTTHALVLEVVSPGPAVTYDLSGVVAIGGNCTGCRALEATDPGFGDPSLLTVNASNSTFVSTGTNGTSVFVQSANANFTHSSIGQQGNMNGTLLMELGTLTFSDGTLGTPGLSINASELAVGGHATFTRTVFSARIEGLRLDGSMAPVDATLNDSLIVTADMGVFGFNGAAATLRNSTVIAIGPHVTGGIQLQAAGGGDAAVNASGTIVRAIDTAVPPVDFDVRLQESGGHVATFTADHSSYSSVDVGGGGTVTPVGSGTNVSGDPMFLDAAHGDFRLSLASPLLDRGAPDLPGELDVTGAPRSQDSNCDGVAMPDIGAFELGAACLRTAIPTGPPAFSNVSMTHRRFRVGKPSVALAPKGTRFLYTLSEAAKVTVTIDRKAAGRKNGRRCAKPRRGLRKRCTRFVKQGALTKQSAAGANSLPFSGRLGRRTLKPGKYRASLRAVNASGQRSKPSRLSFTIVKR